MRNALKLDRQADDSYRAGYCDGWRAATEAIEGLLRRPWMSVRAIYARFKTYMAGDLADWARMQPGELMYPPPFRWGEPPVRTMELPAKRRRHD